MAGEIGAGLEFGCWKRHTPHIIQILSISKMHIALAIDASMFLTYLDVLDKNSWPLVRPGHVFLIVVLFNI